MTEPTVEKILPALQESYGEGAMVTALAQHIVQQWPNMVAEAEDGWHDLQHSLRLTCWNWFSGGDTANLTADRILEALA